MSITEEQIRSNPIILSSGNISDLTANNFITTSLTSSSHNKPICYIDILKSHGNTQRKHFKFGEHVAQFPGVQKYLW